jgi:hypothetical protein
MKQRFRLYRRGATKRFYAHDGMTGKQESSHTCDRAEASRLLHANNEAEHQPDFNEQLARTCFAAGDRSLSGRTWQTVMDAMIKANLGWTESSHLRYTRGLKENHLDKIRHLPLLQTRRQDLLETMTNGTGSTIKMVRRLHTFALIMGWLPWPRIHYKSKRGITWVEHLKL